MFVMDEKIVVITGAASGLGKEIVTELLKTKETKLIIVLDKTEKIQSFESNSFVHYYGVDLTDITQVKDTYKIIEKKYGHIDVLVNNAGKNILVPSLNITEEIWDSIINLNLKGTFFSCKYAFPCLVKSNNASIINIASQFSIIGEKYRSAYAASKAGIVAYTKVLAIEWATCAIRVNAISPTICIKESTSSLLNHESMKKEYLSHIPIGRYCTATDILGAIRFLASENSSMITGHNLIVDGGWTIK